MKKYAMLVIVILLIGFAAGCIGQGKNGSTTTVQSGNGPLVNVTTESQSHTQTTTTTRPPATGNGKTPNLKELLKAVNGIDQFIYVSNTTINMTVTIKSNKTSQSENLTLLIDEKGYIDFQSKSAWINSTTKTPPVGPSTTISRIVIGNATYMHIVSGWVKLNDSRVSEMVWRFNIVGLARTYLTKKPNSIKTGEVTVLTYSVPDYLITPLARNYFATSPNSSVEVQNGTLELYFNGDRLIGGKLSFHVEAEARVKDNLLGEMNIKQKGLWVEMFRITSINVKEEVKAPST
ncbi:hypothetical protein [Thermococcus sp.]|uniref:hypothetical protein n=1 Tax=Thermococcus sp. TaxID=35749 RepID=UPI00261796BA|nr:hypothetical protein [Thermococcus sp.]